jgi:ubiquinol-cytochrome c reductase iron-sulfur subunit
MVDSDTRLLLRVAVKLMSLAGVGLALYALLASVLSGEATSGKSEPLLVRLDALSENQLLRVAWGEGNLLLLERSAATLASLDAETAGLQDPFSERTSEPDGLPAATRSVRPALFVAFDRGTGMGCPLGWVPSGSRGAPQQPWQGGFRDSCDGSWYDAAGRVFKGQQAGRNLAIPPYRYIDGDLLEIGPSRDNAAPAK